MGTNGTHRSHARCHPYPIPQPVKRGWPHHWGLRPLLFFNSSVGSFTSHKNQISVSAVRRDLRFSVLIQDADADVITKAALSPQLFKDPECCSGGGSNPRPPALQTGALPTELTRRRLKTIYKICTLYKPAFVVGITITPLILIAVWYSNFL